MANNGKSRRFKWIVFLIVLAAAAGGGAWYYFHKKNSSTQFVTVPVTRGDLVQTVTATGQLGPVTNITVGSQISGNIQKLYADFNSHVKAGEVIAQLDPSTYKAAVAQAEGDLANAQANEELMQIEANRAADLFNGKLISASDHDTAIANLHQAQAQVKIKQAALDKANVDLSRCTIYAPVDGIVISRNVDVGQTVAASLSAPTLFVIANDLTKMQIDALVSEADIGGVEIGQKVNFTVDAFPERSFQGEIIQKRYGALTNQGVINYDCVVSVSNPDQKLLPGMTANVSIVLAERQNALKISNAALRFRPPEVPEETKTNASPQIAGAGQRGGRPGGGGGRGGNRAGKGGGAGWHTVYVLNKTKDPDHPEMTPTKIKLGINDGMYTEVLEGLKEGDQVITSMISESSTSQPSNPFGGGPFRRF